MKSLSAKDVIEALPDLPGCVSFAKSEEEASLNDEGERHGVNFSPLLQNAVIEKLGL